MKRIVSYILMIVIILGMPRESFAHLEDALNYVADNDVVQQRAIEDAKLY